MSSAVAPADRKSPAVPPARLKALYTALPDVPKSVVQLIDEYLRRLPPSDLIRELSRAISPELMVDSAVFQMDFVCVRAFYSGPQLRALLADRLSADFFDQTTFPAPVSEVLRDLQSEHLSADTVTPALKQLLAEDDGALCAVALPLLHALWCSALLAVPFGANAEHVLRNGQDRASIRSLMGSDSVCGLLALSQPPAAPRRPLPPPCPPRRPRVL
jgi:hypothetical protein